MGQRRSRSRSRSSSGVRRRAAAPAATAPLAPSHAAPAVSSAPAPKSAPKPAFLTLAEMKTKKAFAFLTDSEYITSGYRTPAGFGGALKSLLKLHNESFNVWSHLISALVFGAILVYFAAQGIPPRAAGVVAWARGPVEVYVPAGAPPVPASPPAVASAAAPGELGSLHGLESEFAGLVTTFLDAVVPVDTLTESGSASERAAAVARAAAPAPPTSVLEAKHWLQEMAGWIRQHLPSAGAPAVAAADAAAGSSAASGARPRDLRQLGLHPRPGGLQEHLLAAIDKVRAAVPALPEDVSHVATELVRGGARLAALLKALSADGAGSEAGGVVFMDDGARVANGAAVIPLWPILGYLATAVACFTFSAAFHLFYPVSAHVFKFFNKLDFVGIALLIMGSNFPVISYGFYCEPALHVFYTTLAAVSSAACIWASFSRTFALPKYRTMRALSFVGTAVVGAVPFLHLAFFSSAQCWEALIGLLHMGVLYLLGAFLYATRIPERYRAGRFDIIGSSHNLFHLLVTAAVATHLLASLDHYHWRATRSVCEAPAL